MSARRLRPPPSGFAVAALLAVTVSACGGARPTDTALPLPPRPQVPAEASVPATREAAQPSVSPSATPGRPAQKKRKAARTTAPDTERPTGTSGAGRAATAAWPSKADVGPSGTLTRTGSITATRRGMVIENKVIDGWLRIEADDVTVRNVRIEWNREKWPVRIADGVSGAKLDRIEIDGNTTSSSDVQQDAQAIVGGGYTLTNFHIHDVPEGPRPRSDVTMRVGLIERLVPVGSNHVDAMQILGVTKNVRVEQVAIKALTPSGNAKGVNAALQAGTEVGEVNNVVFTRSFFDGGAVPINLGGGGTRDAAIRFTDNLFGRNARWDLIKYATKAQTFERNVFADDRAPIPLQ